jgi:hypothetical protein
MTGEGAPAARLLEMLDGARVVQALYVAAVLGIPDLLRDEPRDSQELSHATGAHERSLHRLLRALASLDVLAERDDARFALTPLGNLLRSDVQGSLRAAVLFYGGRRHWSAWSRLLDSVKSGTAAFGEMSPDTFFAIAARDPEGATTFNEAMAALTAPVNAAVTAAYDFSHLGTVVDVGGGYGALLAGLLVAHPALRGILFDIEPVIAGARPRIAAAGLAARCELIAGNAFDAVPGGGDAYILKWILHDWNDALSIRILENCRAAMPRDGRLLLVERIVPARAAPTPEAASTFLSDLNMLLLSGSCERTEPEFRALLAAAGFRLTRSVRTSTPHCIIEATPA